MKHEAINLFNNRIYSVCSALVTAESREDVAAAMSALYGLLADAYNQGKADGQAETVRA